MLRYGLKNDNVPYYEPINKEHGDLPLAIELDTHDLLIADPDDLKRLFTIATLNALIHAGHKYRLPTEALEARKAEVESETAKLSEG